MQPSGWWYNYGREGGWPMMYGEIAHKMWDFWGCPCPVCQAFFTLVWCYCWRVEAGLMVMVMGGWPSPETKFRGLYIPTSINKFWGCTIECQTLNTSLALRARLARLRGIVLVGFGDRSGIWPLWGKTRVQLWVVARFLHARVSWGGYLSTI